jgi:hypothetical protein
MAIAPANNAAVNIETVRFISFSFVARLSSRGLIFSSSYCRAISKEAHPAMNPIYTAEINYAMRRQFRRFRLYRQPNLPALVSYTQIER